MTSKLWWGKTCNDLQINDTNKKFRLKRLPTYSLGDAIKTYAFHFHHNFVFPVSIRKHKKPWSLYYKQFNEQPERNNTQRKMSHCSHYSDEETHTTSKQFNNPPTSLTHSVIQSKCLCGSPLAITLKRNSSYSVLNLNAKRQINIWRILLVGIWVCCVCICAHV